MPAPSPDPLRLRRRLGLQGASFALLLLVSFSGAVYLGMAFEERQSLRANARELAASAAAQLPLIAHEFGEAGNVFKFRHDAAVVPPADATLYRIRWFDPQGVLLDDQGQLNLSLAAPAKGAVTATVWREWPGAISLEQPVFTRERNRPGEPARRSGSVQVVLSDQRLRDDLAWLRRGLMLGVLCTGSLVLLVGQRMLDAAFRPLQRQVLALERFTADASHELRHPLTLLRTLVAAAQPAAQAAQNDDLLGRVDRIAARMGLLLDDLLLLARHEHGIGEGSGEKPRWRRFDLLELLDDLVDLYTPQAAERQVRLVQSRPIGLEELPLNGQPEQLQRLFTNLLLNAIRHSPDAGRVLLTVCERGGRVRVILSDEGPGIPTQQQGRIFRRFWRGDGAGDGGLGLPIARAIARAHGGDVELADGSPGCCTFRVELPIAG
jgi:hypothetical protein